MPFDDFLFSILFRLGVVVDIAPLRSGAFLLGRVLSFPLTILIVVPNQVLQLTGPSGLAGSYARVRSFLRMCSIPVHLPF